MFDIEDVMKRLRNGEDIEKIAQEAIGIVNDANKRYTAEQDQKAKEEAAKKRTHEAKENRMYVIINDIIAYIREFYPEVKITQEDIDNLDLADLVDDIDDTMSTVSCISECMKKIKNIDTDKAIADFIDNMKW